MKECANCKQSFTLDSFYARKASKDGLSRLCKICDKKACAIFRLKNKESIALKKRIYAQSNKQKINAYMKEWKIKNKDKVQKYNATSKTKNSENIKQSHLKWRSDQNNKIKLKEYERIWRMKNPGKSSEKTMRYAARKLNAMPAWADKFIISEIYDLAVIRSKTTGVKFEVDHVIPLQGKNVCGLHIETNLQIIPMKLNRNKSNKFDINSYGIFSGIHV